MTPNYLKLLVMRNTGTGGESIYGDRFDDEAFPVNHTKPLLLSMASSKVHRIPFTV